LIVGQQSDHPMARLGNDHKRRNKQYLAGPQDGIAR